MAQNKAPFYVRIIAATATAVSSVFSILPGISTEAAAQARVENYDVRKGPKGMNGIMTPKEFFESDIGRNFLQGLRDLAGTSRPTVRVVTGSIDDPAVTARIQKNLGVCPFPLPYTTDATTVKFCADAFAAEAKFYAETISDHLQKSGLPKITKGIAEGDLLLCDAATITTEYKGINTITAYVNDAVGVGLTCLQSAERVQDLIGQQVNTPARNLLVKQYERFTQGQGTPVASDKGAVRPLPGSGTYYTFSTPINVYPTDFQPFATKLRQTCNAVSLDTSDGRACISARWDAILVLAANVKASLQEAKRRVPNKTSSAGRGLIRSFDAGIANIDTKCLTPIGHGGALSKYTQGKRMGDAFDRITTNFETCITEMGFVTYGHVDSYQGILARSATNSTPYFLALQELAGHGLNLRSAMDWRPK